MGPLAAAWPAITEQLLIRSLPPVDGLDLPDDLHKQALAIARDTHRTLSQTVADLMRRGLGTGTPAAISTDSRTGLPLVSVGRIVTSEDVRSLEDEE